jgi:phenylpropionate dioxygenase-like ring-hydroxylating dioxygenase large terminal subunit
MHPEAEIWCLQRDCNWLQALEGDIDTSHVGFLHVGSIEADDLDEDHDAPDRAEPRAGI